MPAYKDEKRGTWYVQFYYTDWTGEKKKKYIRGFETKRQAKDYEKEFESQAKGNVDMMMDSFIKTYFKDKEGELKERSIKNKKHMIKKHISPYFGSKRLNEITPSDIINWQNSIRKKGYSQTYLRMLQNQITAIFNHAQRIYNLDNNPCKKVKKMGKSDAGNLDFWTYEEYQKFIDVVDKKSYYYVIFEILFWTGCRSGELLALDRESINFENNQIYISKTYYRNDKRDIITSPKTEGSIRTIDIPEFLTDEIRDYYNRLYDYPKEKRLFPIGAEALQHKMKRDIIKAGIKKIRVHDLRHSHVAYLIHQGVQPLIIKERLGHQDIKMTLNTYGHLYPSEQKKVALMLGEKKLEVQKQENAPAKNKSISR